MDLLKKIFSKRTAPGAAEIREAVRGKYREVAASAEGKFKYSTGRTGAEALKYDQSIIDAMPEGLIESFCGVGNPFSLGPVEAGQSVLDVGCGAGFDLITAGRLVGPEGRASGIDLTPEMVEKARRYLETAGIAGEVKVAGCEELPFPDEEFDLVISNGVLNLSPEKEKCFAEILRVLKPGGRLQFADIVLKGDLPDEKARSLDAWSD
ncbi:MAG: methyltransferase domain-containing protein [Nitrospirota bacterium]|jgi:arsenite methyltransferase